MISLCMITRNESHCLARCLRSVRPVVEEIVVVDTGSVDRTVEIARELGARVYGFQWCDDFSAARNLALAKARGEWVFSLDADEVISQRDHGCLKRLAGDISAAQVAYSIVTRNYINDSNKVGWTANDGRYGPEEAGCGWIPTEKVRLFPNHQSIRFSYPVHEMVEPSLRRAGVEIRGCGFPIHHYGPLAEENTQSKMMAYYRMGKDKLDQLENHPIALRELAVQAAILGKMAEAIELWEKFIAVNPDVPEAYIHLTTAYLQSGQYREARQSAKKALTIAPGMKEALYNYALGEFISGELDKTVLCLENLQAKYPGFLPAKFVLAAARICSGRGEEGVRNMWALKNTDINLAITCRDLAGKLMEGGWPDWARTLLAASRYVGSEPFPPAGRETG